MRRFTLVASAILLTYLPTSLLFGQRGAAHSGGAGNSHFSGAHAPAATGFTGIASGAFSSNTRSGARPPTFTGYTGIAPGAISRGGRNYYSRGFVPFFGYPYFSTFDSYSDPSYYNNYVQDPGAQTDQATANLLGEQVDRLSAEVAQLRGEGSTLRGGPASPYAYAAPVADPPQANDPPIVLVMQDGSKKTMQSYAVMGQNFWDFSVQPARKIAFSDVNLAASQKATESSGAEFPALR